MPTYAEVAKKIYEATKELDGCEVDIDGKPAQANMADPFLYALSFVEGVMFGVLKGVSDPPQLDDAMKFAASVVAHTITQGSMTAPKGQDDKPGGYA